MRRSDSRSGLTRSSSTRSVSSNADSNAARSAAAAAASALANAQRRSSIDGNAARPSTASSGLGRRDSVGSLKSSAGATSNRPGQYSAVRQTGSRRLYGNANGATAAASGAVATANARPSTPVTQTTQLRETMRSKPPQVASSQRRQQNMSSSASIRSFQSDLERINEDYNKTYAYAGQTSASAMRLAAPASARGRRAESVVSSAMSDTSEAPQDAVQRRKASRVSFSDIDDGEGQSRNPSPNPEKRRSALKSSASPSANGTPGRGVNSGSTLMPPPVLQRRGSNSSMRSNTSVGLGNTPTLAPPIQKQTQVVSPNETKPEGEDGNLSTIESNSAYSDADEDFKASPALQRQGVLTSSSPDPPMQLTQQNLAAVAGSSPTKTPLKSALKKTPSQSGSARFSRLETDSQLDVADDESDDSFAARRRAKQIGGKRSLTTLRGTNGPKEPTRRTSTNGSVNGNASVEPSPVAMRRSNSITSQQSRTSQGPSRMVSLRQNPPQKRQSISRRMSAEPTVGAPVISRRASMQSIAASQPPLPPKSVRRASVAGSVADSVRSDAVNQHVAVMELAQRRVQKMLHPDAPATAEGAPDVYSDAPERRRSSFERKRPSTLSRQNSSSSMIDRSFRTSLRPEPKEAPSPQTHRRAASDDRVFATTMRGPSARPPPPRAASSSFLGNTATDTQSMPTTPRKSSRRMSFGFGRKKNNQDDVPPVPAMRKYSSDSDTFRTVNRPATANALSAGTLRTSAPRAGGRQTSARRDQDSDIVYSEKTGKPKKFQALRRLFKIKN